MRIKGPITPAIYSVIAIAWTNRWVMGCTVLSGNIHTWDRSGYCQCNARNGSPNLPCNGNRWVNSRCDWTITLHLTFPKLAMILADLVDGTWTEALYICILNQVSHFNWSLPVTFKLWKYLTNYNVHFSFVIQPAETLIACVENFVSVIVIVVMLYLCLSSFK